MINTETLLNSVKASVKEIAPEAEVVLFGSRARGEIKEEADWDLLILLPYETNLALERLFRHKLFELELHYGQCFSVMLLSKAEWESKLFVTPLYKNIKQEGIKL